MYLGDNINLFAYELLEIQTATPFLKIKHQWYVGWQVAVVDSSVYELLDLSFKIQIYLKYL